MPFPALSFRSTSTWSSSPATAPVVSTASISAITKKRLPQARRGPTPPAWTNCRLLSNEVHILFVTRHTRRFVSASLKVRRETMARAKADDAIVMRFSSSFKATRWSTSATQRQVPTSLESDSRRSASKAPAWTSRGWLELLYANAAIAREANRLQATMAADMTGLSSFSTSFPLFAAAAGNDADDSRTSCSRQRQSPATRAW